MQQHALPPASNDAPGLCDNGKSGKKIFYGHIEIVVNSMDERSKLYSLSYCYTSY